MAQKFLQSVEFGVGLVEVASGGGAVAVGGVGAGLAEVAIEAGFGGLDVASHAEALGLLLTADLVDGAAGGGGAGVDLDEAVLGLSLIHISEPTRQAEISYAVF